MVRVKWQGKDLLRYDGKTQDIKRRDIMSEYQDGMAVGSTVRMHWGRKSRIWTAVVVDQLPLHREDELMMIKLLPSPPQLPSLRESARDMVSTCRF